MWQQLLQLQPMWQKVYRCWSLIRQEPFASKVSIQKKITGLFGNFSQTSDPPTPPFGNFDHFLPYYFGQVGNFWVILRCFKGVFRAMVRITKVLGMRRPPPYVGKNSQIIPYFFSDAFPKGKWSNLVIHSTSFLIFPIAHHSEMSLEWRNEAEMKECNRKIMNDRNERNGHWMSRTIIATTFLSFLGMMRNDISSHP